jgi:hypothetical protein
MSSELTLGDAAKAVGRGMTTVREWVKSGHVRAKRNTLGHWLIERDSLLAYASGEGAVEGPRRRRGAEALPARGSSEAPTAPLGIPTAEALIRSLEREIEHLRRLLDEERERSRLLESERTQHMAEMRALLSREQKEGAVSRWFRK